MLVNDGIQDVMQETTNQTQQLLVKLFSTHSHSQSLQTPVHVTEAYFLKQCLYRLHMYLHPLLLMMFISIHLNWLLLLLFILVFCSLCSFVWALSHLMLISAA